MLTPDQRRLSISRSIFIGLGFLIITATWTLYNAYVPIFLKRFIQGETLIGFIMTLDNIAAITLQPFFGALSDSTNTRFGHRLPFILIGAPIAALFYALIPLANNFILLITVIAIMNLAMSVFRSPTVALMPDLTPAKMRSKANGIINFMGGLGATFILFGGSYLYDINPVFPFVLLSVLLIIITLFYLFKLKEPEKTVSEERINIIEVIKDIFSIKNRNVLFVLLAIFFWFFGYSAVETFFTLYGTEFLMIKESAAAMSLSFFSGSFLFFAIPSGYIAILLGRKKIIKTGIIGLLATFGALVFLRDVLLIRIFLAFGGVFWAFININSYPIIADAAGKKIGAYTGVYYLFSTLPAILSPLLVGWFLEHVGYHTLFIYAVIAFIIALFFMMKVKKRELYN